MCDGPIGLVCAFGVCAGGDEDNEAVIGCLTAGVGENLGRQRLCQVGVQ